jgi:hypothetical protein
LAFQGLWRLLGCLLTAMSVAVPVIWLAWHGCVAGASLPWPAAALSILTAATGVFVFWQDRRRAAARAPVRLRWTGAAWQSVYADGTVETLARLHVRVDLGVAMLARALGPDRCARWLPLERRDAPSSWHALRVALAQATGERPVGQAPGAVA